jgi:chitinase
VAYLPDYRISSFQPEMAAPLTDLIVFSVRPTADGHVADPTGLLSKLEPFTALRKSRPIRLLLCVGGGKKERSEGFAPMAADAASRARFVGELVAIAVRYRFDGIDVDWEHMTEGDAAERRAFSRLLREIKQALAPRGLLLTVAVGDAAVLDADAVDAVDRIHLMLYDGPRHGTFAQFKAKVDRALEQGVPARKMCVGIPLYALGASPEQTLSYERLVATYHPAPLADDAGGYRFSGVETTRQKVLYANEKRLGGVMFWELSQDAAGPLSMIKTVADMVHSSGP